MACHAGWPLSLDMAHLAQGTTAMHVLPASPACLTAACCCKAAQLSWVLLWVLHCGYYRGSLGAIMQGCCCTGTGNPLQGGVPVHYAVL